MYFTKIYETSDPEKYLLLFRERSSHKNMASFVFVSGQRTPLVREKITRIEGRVVASDPPFNRPREGEQDVLQGEVLLNYPAYGVSLPVVLARLLSHPHVLSWLRRMNAPLPKSGLDFGMVKFLAPQDEYKDGKDNLSKTLVVLEHMKAEAAIKRLKALRSDYVQWCLKKNGPTTLVEFQAYVQEVLGLSDEIDLCDDELYEVTRVGTLLGLEQHEATFLSQEVARLDGKEKPGDSSYRWLSKLLCSFRPLEGCITDIVNFAALLTKCPEKSLKALVRSVEQVLSALDGKPEFELPDIILGDGEQDDIYTVAILQALREKQDLPPAHVIWQVPAALEGHYSFPFVDECLYDPESKNTVVFEIASRAWKNMTH